jgi:hypothetical protein
MLRITVRQEIPSIALLVEGKLMGDWVDELRKVWSGIRWIRSNEGAMVDITAVLGVDAAGRHLLAEIYSSGGVLVGTGLFARTLIQEITGVAS